MTSVAVTNTFSSGTTMSSSQVNTNYSDLVTYINNRNSGSATWDIVKISSTSSNALSVVSSASGSTEVSIDNTATDGDPQVTFKLGGSQVFVIGSDDSDSDFLKFATTGITTNVAMQIPTTGVQVQVANGSISVPSLGWINDPDTGLFLGGTNIIGFTTGGAQSLQLSATDLSPVPDNAVALGTTSFGWTRIFMKSGLVGSPSYTFRDDSDSGLYNVSANLVALMAGGVESIRVDASATATQTRLLVYDVDKGAVSRVTVGANDSGGAGFKLLRVPN